MGGLDEEVAAPEADTPAPGITVAAEVSLAVAAKASGENFPVALRVLPEPASFGIFGLGAIGLLGPRRRRGKN